MSQPPSIGIIEECIDRFLRLRVIANIGGRNLHRAPHLRRQRSFHRYADTITVEAIELSRVFQQRRIAALSNVRKYRRNSPLCFFQTYSLARDQRSGVFIIENPYHYITILLRGYSTIPCAPASFSRGIRFLQPRNNRAHGGLIEDGVYGQPLRITERGNRRILQRRQHRQHRRQIRFRDVEHEPTISQSIDCAFKQHADIFQFAAP